MTSTLTPVFHAEIPLLGHLPFGAAACTSISRQVLQISNSNFNKNVEILHTYEIYMYLLGEAIEEEEAVEKEEAAIAMMRCCRLKNERNMNSKTQTWCVDDQSSFSSW